MTPDVAEVNIKAREPKMMNLSNLKELRANRKVSKSL